MDNETASQLSTLFPKYASYITLGCLILGIAGRAYHAVSTGGGLMAIWNGLVKGTNAPTAKQEAVATAASDQPKTPLLVPTGAATPATPPPGSLVGAIQTNPTVPTTPK